MLIHVPVWLSGAGAAVIAAGSWVVRDGLRFWKLLQAVESAVSDLSHVFQPATPLPQTKGPIMPLLNLLPAGILAYLQSPEASDDLKVAEALLAGDATAATAAVKKALLDAPIPEPYKELTDLLANSDAFDSFLAGKLLDETNALKAAIGA